MYPRPNPRPEVRNSPQRCGGGGHVILLHFASPKPRQAGLARLILSRAWSRSSTLQTWCTTSMNPLANLVLTFLTFILLLMVVSFVYDLGQILLTSCRASLGPATVASSSLESTEVEWSHS